MAFLQGASIDPNQFAALMRKVLALEEFIKSRSTVDDLPGARVPYDLVLQADVGANTTAVTDVEQVTDAGPHICTELIGVWRDNTANKYGPVSSHVDLSTSTVNAFDGLYNLTDTGTGQLLSNKDVPTAALFSQDRPAYLSSAWHIRKNSSVKMQVTPIVAPSAAGTVHIILRGYRVLTGLSVL